MVSGFVQVHRNQWKKIPKGNFDFSGYLFCAAFSISQGLSLLSEAGLVEGYRFPVLVSVGLASQQLRVLSKREKEGGKPKETQPLHPSCAPDWLFREKKMKEAWKRGALMEERKGAQGNISELWSSSHASPWVLSVTMVPPWWGGNAQRDLCSLPGAVRDA